MIGAGTVTSIDQARRCIDAGAKYIVSPVIINRLSEISHRMEVPCILGALTPNELYSAVQADADAVKIFPINNIGGINYFRTLKSIFPKVRLVPTGGVTHAEISLYLESGATFVGIGGELFNEKMIKEGQREKVIKLGQSALKASNDFKSEENG